MVIKNYLPSPIGQKKFKDNDLQLEIYTTKTWTCTVTSSYVSVTWIKNQDRKSGIYLNLQSHSLELWF